MKKSKKNPVLYIFELVGTAVIYLFKAFFHSVKFLFNTVKKTSSSVGEIKKEASRPRNIAKDVEFKELKKIAGSIEDFTIKMLLGKSTIGLIIGARGTGKSALGIRILENIHATTEKQVYALGFKKESLPRWIKVVDDINEVASNSLILVDEGGITFSSRNAMSDLNKLLTNMLLVARHNDLSLIFISQNSSNIEVNTLRQADYLLLKRSSLLQKDFERKKIQDIYKEAEKDFKSLQDVGLTYIYSDQYRGFVSNSLPSFWSDDVSKAFKKE
jgi:hypothetical protein